MTNSKENQWEVWYVITTSQFNLCYIERKLSHLVMPTAVHWYPGKAGKMQTVTLSTYKLEYVALATAMQESKFLIHLIEKCNKFRFIWLCYYTLYIKDWNIKYHFKSATEITLKKFTSGFIGFTIV